MVQLTRSVLLLVALLLPGVASAQPFPPPSYPWVLNGHQVNPGSFEIVTTPSTAGASGFNIPPGIAPSSPQNGDIWTTNGGMYVQINGATVGPLGTGGGGGGTPASPTGSVQINAGAGLFGGITPANNALLSTNGSGVAGWQNKGSLSQVGTLSGATAVIFDSSGILQLATLAGSGSSLSIATTTGPLVNGDCVSINNNSFVDSGVPGCGGGGGGGSGTVSAGLANQIAYYPSAGTVVAGLSIVNNALLGTNGSGVPAFTTTLPSALTIPSPILSGTVAGSNTIPLSILTTIASKGVLGNATGSTGNVTVAWSVPNTTDLIIPLVHGAIATIGDLTCFNDTAGTLKDCGTTLPTAVQSNITQLGTITAGVWHGTVVGATYGGTGIDNGSSTITLGASLVTTGGGAATLAFPNSPATFTFPTSSATLAALNITQAYTAIQNFNNGSRDCSGHNWIDVTCPTYGAVSDGATNNVTAIANAITTAGPGGVVYFPSGGTGFCAWPLSGSTTFTITQQSLTLQFQSATTVLSTCGHDATLIALEGNDDQITNGLLSCFGSPDDPKFGSYAFSSPSHDCLVIQDNGSTSQCAACILFNTTVHGGFNAITNTASAVEMYGVYGGFNYGNAIYYSKVDPTGNSDGSAFVNYSFFDNNYPGVCGGPATGQTSVAAWQASHNYSTPCTIITIGSGAYYVQNLSACTSGSGSAPSVKFYRQNISDNTCTWQLTNPASLNGVVLDTGSHENYFSQVDITGATFNAILVENSLSGAEPQQFYCRKCSPALGIATAVSLTAGSLINFEDNEIGAGFAASANGIQTSGAFNSSGQIQGVSISGGYVTGNTWGINLTAGHNNTISGANIVGGGSGAINMSIGFSTITGNTLVGGGGGNGIEIDGTPAHVVCYGNNATGTFTNVVNGSPSSGSCSTSNNF